MSVQSVTRMWSKTTAAYTSQKFDRFDNSYTFQEGYSVVCTVDTEAPEIRIHPDIPRAGDAHPAEPNAFVESVSVDRTSPIHWMVTVSYAGFELEGGAVEIEWSDTTSSEAIDRDISGSAIVTANGEAVQGLTMEISDPVVTIRRRYLYLNAYAVAAYRHAVNIDTFLGWPPGTARLVGYSARSAFKYQSQLEAWDVTARIQFRLPLGGAAPSQAWHKRWRHEGIYVRAGGVLQKARDELGNEVSSPVLLKNDGTQEFNPNNAVFKYTQVYSELPYAALGLLD